MAFEPSKWADGEAGGTPITAAELNRIESAGLAAAAAPTWASVTGKPSTFTPATHAHVVADVTSLQASLDAKAATSHTHTIANVTSLQGALDGKAAASHTHTATQVTATAIAPGTATTVQGILAELAARIAALEV